MSILQPFKMAWRSIVGKKGRSTLTILSIFIGIAAVMTIVSVMEGMKLQVMKQFNAMGTNRIEIQIEVYSSDESGNSAGVDYFPKLYSYRQGLSASIAPNRNTLASHTIYQFSKICSANPYSRFQRSAARTVPSPGTCSFQITQ